MKTIRAKTIESNTKELPAWQLELKSAYRSAEALCNALGITAPTTADYGFPVLVPRPYVQRIAPNTPNDPLLLQVLSSLAEGSSPSGFSKDPLKERDANPQPGIVHKYRSRVLFIATGQCAVNCRYCFRRHFPYSDNRLSQAQWHEQIAQIAQDPEVNEIILSGGDPLLLNDNILASLLDAIEKCSQIKRLRIHTRLPLVIPQRVNNTLLTLLSARQFDIVMVWHINHPNEIDDAVVEAAKSLQSAGVTQLNQSVLLHQVNDDSSVLAALSEKLFSAGILPYYLHLLDKVEGASHFMVSDAEAHRIYRQLAEILPGFLLPRLAREQAGLPYKSTYGTHNL